MSQLRLRHVQCFLETARLGSLGAAAERLRISQPAASKTIKELEQILGADLFDRSQRRLTLNRAGLLFQQHAGAAMIDLQKAQDLVRTAGVTKTRVSVGVLPTASTNLVPRAALRFREAFPDCILRIATGPNWHLLSQLRTGDLDLVVGRMANPERMEGLSFQHLFTEQVVAVVRPGHPLCEGRITPEAMADYPLILPPKGALISSTVSAFLLSHGMQMVEPAFESVALAFGRKVLALSDAIWLISRGVVADDLETGTLTMLDFDSRLLAGPVGISLRDTSVITPETRGLIRLLEETATLPVVSREGLHN